MTTQALIESVATALHEAWRELCLGEDPKASRFSRLPDGDAVDILQTSFEHLPLSLQGENLQAARHILLFLESHPGAPLEVAAAEVHQAWLSRHPDADEALRVPYPQLAESEKNKDRQIVLIAQRAMRDSSTGQTGAK